MLQPFYSKQFEKDIKRQKKRGKNLNKLKQIMELLINEKKLPVRNRDHRLTGNFKNYRECHIEPDWLMLYKATETEIYFTRIGSHSDLFQ